MFNNFGNFKYNNNQSQTQGLTNISQQNQLKTSVNNKDQISNKLSSVKLICKIHNSEIGGVCGDMDCKDSKQLFCIKCTINESCCIRKYKHNLISFDEFVNLFFDKHLPSFKSNYTYSRGLNNIENYIGKEEDYLLSFRSKFEELSNIVNSTFENFMQQINSIVENINNQIMEVAQIEQTNFLGKLDKLKEMMNNDLLHNFDAFKCKETMQRMPFDSFNDAIYKIKQTFTQIKNKDYSKDEERLNSYMAVSMDKIKVLASQLEEIETEVVNKSEQVQNEISILFSDNYNNKSNNTNSYNFTTKGKNNNAINNNKSTINSLKQNDSVYFNKVDKTKVSHINSQIDSNNLDQKESESDDNQNQIAQPQENSQNEFYLQNIDIAKEFPIDYSVNSNFLDKKFIVFEHSNGDSILCYPTSLFTLKLESLDLILKEPEPQKRELKISKDVFNQERKNFNQIDMPLNNVTSFPKATDRDKFLKLKLQGHGANIIDIKYYQVGISVNKENKDRYEQNVLKDKKNVENRSLNSNLVNNVFNENKNKKDSKEVTDYLISASDDRTVKIWNISNLKDLNDQSNQINLNNNYNYTSCLLRTLIHQNSIVGIQVFFNPLKNANENLELVTLSYGDKIRVYDLRTYQMKKDVTQITNANYDSVFAVFNIDNAYNFLITANHLNKVRIWDYELNKVLHTVTYPDSKVINLFCIPTPEGYNSENVLIVDDKSTNATLNVKTFIMSKLNCQYKSYRSCALLIDNNNVLFGCKNGTIHRFCFESLKVEEVFDVFNGISQGKPVGVTDLNIFYHNTFKDLLFAHYQNQKLLIYSFK